MPVFLKNSNDFSNLIPAIEMAEYEWTFNDVFDAVDKNAIKFDDVATIAPDAWTTLRFELQPSCHIHNHKWNGKAFPDICECLYEFHEDDATMRAAELLKSWVEEGLIVELDYLKI